MILSCFAQKLVNSGFSVPSAQYILVHGVTKFNLLVRNSELPVDHENFKPLYLDSDHDIHGRKLHKMLSKTGWYEDSDVFKKSRWRQHLPRGWSGCKPLQYSVKGMKYSTIMQVPSSKNGRLIRMLAKAEPRLAKLSKYQVKYVERSGRKLSKFFPTETQSVKCFRPDCHVCATRTAKGPSLCNVKGVVYTGTCKLCDLSHKQAPGSKHAGLYVGQTARTLKERAEEHVKSYRRYESKSFMFKHWVTTHPEISDPPEFMFSVIKKHKDPLTRLVHEAVKILDCASMNSKSEWNGFKIARLCVDTEDWQKKKEVAEVDLVDSKVEGEMHRFRENLVANARLCSNSVVTKDLLDYRLRKRTMNQQTSQETPAGAQQSAKRPRSGTISSTSGSWNPKRRVFSRKNGSETPVHSQQEPTTSTPNVVAPPRGAVCEGSAMEMKEVSPLTQPETPSSVSSTGSNARFLTSALDDYESSKVLEGSGDSAILSVPIYRCPSSFASDTSSQSSNSSKEVPVLNLRRKLGETAAVTPTKISKLSTTFNQLIVKAAFATTSDYQGLPDSPEAHMVVETSPEDPNSPSSRSL